ncbi:hypothetical protein, partial [Flavobacterium sp.]|uniref:hypothetical protein n=1 Tax=Flavobacterium sp. TaxID=239 RepID=UPI002631805E
MNSQLLEKNENLKKYKSVLITSYPESKLPKWISLYHLKNGIIIEHENYLKDELMRKTEFIYDNQQNLNYEIEKFNRNKGYKIDTVSKYNYTYNDKNQLIEKQFNSSSLEKYSDFNKLNLAQTIDRTSSLDSIFGYKEEMI